MRSYDAAGAPGARARAPHEAASVRQSPKREQAHIISETSASWPRGPAAPPYMYGSKEQLASVLLIKEVAEVAALGLGHA